MTYDQQRHDETGNQDEQDEAESPRQQARRERKQAGDRSAQAAHTLMQLPEAEVDRLELDDDLRAAVDSARAVIPRVARRREERRLAKDLRNADLDALEASLTSLQDQAQADVRAFQRAEIWRERLLQEDAAAEAFHAEHPGLDQKRWHQLVNSAQRERDRGKPRGAKRELFRAVMAVLRGDSSD
jgi:ribosome-associated protein